MEVGHEAVHAARPAEGTVACGDAAPSTVDEFQALGEQEQHILFAVAMLHDVEKRSTTKREIQGGKERIVSPNHAKKGEYTARTLLYTELAAP